MAARLLIKDGSFCWWIPAEASHSTDPRAYASSCLTLSYTELSQLRWGSSISVAMEMHLFSTACLIFGSILMTHQTHSKGRGSAVGASRQQNHMGWQPFVLIRLFQWIPWPPFCSLHGGLRCFHAWPTWSGTSGWTVSSQPPTRAPAPTASIGRTAVWWAAPSPTPSPTCPQRTAGGATSAWWLRICAASPGPRLPMRGPSPTPAGFTRATTSRRTAWPSITVRTFLFCPLKTGKNHLKHTLLWLQGFFQSAPQWV